MTAEQHFRGLQYLHRTLAIGTVTGLVSVYARLLTPGSSNELHSFSGLSIYCCLLAVIRIKFYLDDEDHFQVMVSEADASKPPEMGDLIDAIFSCLSWIAFLAAVALLQFATLSRNAIMAAMISSVLWVCASIYRDKERLYLKFHRIILFANLIYIALFILMNLANPSWPGQHATDLGGYILQEKWTLCAFLVCFIDWWLTYLDQGRKKADVQAVEAAPATENKGGC